MKKQTIATIVSILLVVTLVSAGIFDVVSTMDKTTEIDKVYRDYLLTKVPTTLDSKGVPLVKEIKPVISIDCNEEQCKYSASQSGIINSQDNIIDRKYCSLINETDSSCITYSTYTIAEIETKVSEQVTKRLSDYANTSIERDTKAFDKASEGTISVGEK